MLKALSIRDFVIVERLELEFEDGFTVLTGETGAGKSILIDALALVLGARAEGIAVREGAERAEVSAEFDLARTPRLAEWLEEREIADDGALLVRRVVDASGRSRAFINGTPATAAQLREAGEFLVDIHGQHEHQSLLRAGAQRELLDGYGGLEEAARRTRALFRAWQHCREACAQFEANAAGLAAERGELEWQARELGALGYTAEGWDELNAEHGRLANATGLIEGAQFGLETLSEGESCAQSQLHAVASRLEGLVEHDASLREVVDQLRSAGIQVQEAVYSLRHYHQKLDVDPQRLREVESRMQAVHDACRKLRIAPEDIPAARERASARLAELDAGGDPEELRRLEDEARAAFVAEAALLGAQRRKAAARLSAEVSEAMQALAMAGGRFDAVLETLAEPAAHGLEQVEFRVAAHQSMMPQALARVASGGELSRLSLAIQTVTSRVAPVPTLVFDEVDAGIGGRVAEIVGTMLKALGRSHQVMCITHLPQVAAAADHQWQVAKTATKTKVSSSVLALDSAQRIEEIARMLGGVKITETTRRHAAEMLGAKAAARSPSAKNA